MNDLAPSGARCALVLLSLLLVACGPAPIRPPDRPRPPEDGAMSVPPPPHGPRSFRLVVISDSNARYGSVEQARRGLPEALATIRATLRPDLVVHNGDQIAAGGRHAYASETVRAMWEAFHITVTDVLRSGRIPLLPVPGNHDVFPKPLDALYAETWREVGPPLPLADGHGYPRRYSLRFRGTALVVLDAPSGRMSAKEQRWLADELADAADADLRIVFSHVPIAPLTARDYGSLRPLDAMYEALVGGDASLLVTSHDEVYFPGWFRELRVLATGGLGGTCRNLRGVAGCQGMSFAVIDVVDGRIAHVFAMSGPGFERVFDESTLPDMLPPDYRRHPTLTGPVPSATPRDPRRAAEDPRCAPSPTRRRSTPPGSTPRPSV